MHKTLALALLLGLAPVTAQAAEGPLDHWVETLRAFWDNAAPDWVTRVEPDYPEQGAANSVRHTSPELQFITEPASPLIIPIGLNDPPPEDEGPEQEPGALDP